MNGRGYDNWPDDKQDIKDRVSLVCTVGSVLWLVYCIVRNYIQDGMQPLETVIHDPFSFIFTLVPVGISILIHISRIIDEGFRGPETVAFIIKPLLRIGGIFICLILIIFLDLDTGLNLPDGITFLKKCLALLGLSFLSSVCFAYIDGDSVLDCILRETGIFFSVLCIVNGCVETAGGLDVLMAHGESLIEAWVCGIIFLSFLYFFYALVCLFFGVIAFILHILGLRV